MRNLKTANSKKTNRNRASYFFLKNPEQQPRITTRSDQRLFFFFAAYPLKPEVQGVKGALTSFPHPVL
jgi:hypothetical protein